MASIESPPYEPFSVSVVPHRRAVGLAPCGELDLSAAEELEHEARALTQAGFAELVVDLRRVAFIDSAGLRVLLTLRNDAQRHGHGFELVAGRPQVQRIFEITSTRELFAWRAEWPTQPAA
ncbi:MAG TPA: STAS domain-containing protein [Solirubrobacteraceae bacterium]